MSNTCRNILLRSVALVAILATIFGVSSAGVYVFDGDPLPSTPDPCISKVFMRIDSTYHSLHTGLDINGREGNPVCIHTDSAVVRGFSDYDGDGIDDAVLVAAIGPDSRYTGKEVYCVSAHIDPLVVDGDTLVRGETVGMLDSQKHLHEEIAIDWSGNLVIDWWDLVNPLVFAHDDFGVPWKEDHIPPSIDSIRVHFNGTAYVWKVYARDSHRSWCPFDTGLYRLTLFVNGQPADEVRFNCFEPRFSSYMTWADYYCEYDTDVLCYTLFWEPGAGDTLPEPYRIEVWDYWGLGDYEDTELQGCLDGCDTWGCIKACYGGGGLGSDLGSGSSWPLPRACPGTGTCYPEGAFGRMGGYDLYWVNFDSAAWYYELWDTPSDDPQMLKLCEQSPSGRSHLHKHDDADSSVYHSYMVFSMDDSLRFETPRPSHGNIVGVGQCRLEGRALCTALDTSGAVLFLGEEGGLLEIVDVSDPTSPSILAGYSFSELGLWTNVFDDPRDMHFDDNTGLWVVCGNKGLARLHFGPGYQSADTVCTYPVPGIDMSFFEFTGSCGGTLTPPPLKNYYIYYTTSAGDLEVVRMAYGPGIDTFLHRCGEYGIPGGETMRVDATYALTEPEGCYLYVQAFVGYEHPHNGLQVVDISSPCGPEIVSSIRDAYRIRAHAGTRMLGNYPEGDYASKFAVFDISSPDSPSLIGKWENELFSESPERSKMSACWNNRMYSLGYAYVEYGEGSRYGRFANWGGIEIFNFYETGAFIFSAVVTDTGYSAAGDTSFVATTITAAEGKVFITYTCAPDTDSVADPPFNRLKVYLDNYELYSDASVQSNGRPPPVGSMRISAVQPNPFTGDAVIVLSLPHRQQVSITIHDVRGRRVMLLAQDILAPGRHRVKWNGLNENGERVSPGVYFVRLTSADASHTAKLVLMK